MGNTLVIDIQTKQIDSENFRGSFKCDDCRIYIMSMEMRAYGVLWSKGGHYVCIMKYWNDVIIQSWQFRSSIAVWLKVQSDEGGVFEFWNMEKAAFIYTCREGSVTCS